MKHITILLLLAFASGACYAQTSEEWFNQRETQKKYLIKQIAAFKVYLGYVQKGYSIAQKGLTTISNIKKGDFDLHRDFFNSLKSVNPNISGYAKVAAIIALQVRIVEIYKDCYRQVQVSKSFNAEEVNYIFYVFTNLLDDCTTILAELTRVILPNNLEMKDDERIEQIDALYSTMQENYTFAQSFGTEAKLLIIQRMKEKRDVQTSRILNGIKSK